VVAAEITGCSAQGANVYACDLQVRLGPALPINTVFSVDIDSGAFANPSGNASPEVRSSPGCNVPPLPSPYLADGDHYNRYDVNISTGGCQSDAEVTFNEAVAGTAGSTISQAVTVPGFNTATTSFQLPAAGATPTPDALASDPNRRRDFPSAPRRSGHIHTASRRGGDLNDLHADRAQSLRNARTRNHPQLRRVTRGLGTPPPRVVART
jgi:hypothetical protein